MHPDDLPRYKTVMGDALARSAAAGDAPAAVAITRRIRLLDGSYAWIHTSGAFVVRVCMSSVLPRGACALMR